MTLQEEPPAVKYRLTVADYTLLAESGAFADKRTELIDGDVLLMSPQLRPHLFVKSELGFRLRLALRELGGGLWVGEEGSVELSARDMPLPDIIATDEPRGAGAVPLASVALIVEVADTSLAFDLGPKAQLYAAAGIPEYWVADVNGRVLHQHSRPEGGTYADRRTIPFGELVAAATIPGLTIATDDL